MKYYQQLHYLFLLPVILCCCNSNNASPDKAFIDQLNLKRGQVISCGPPGAQFGSVDFDMTCNEKSRQDFNLAIELLHSFEYDEAEKTFAKVIDQTPECAMAYWGVAMCNFHPLWNPPAEAELQKGAKAIAIANSIKTKSAREAGYINAIGLFYKDWNITGHHTRCVYFEKAMEQLHTQYPDDHEAAIFYALALDASADPTDKTYANQKKAGAILNALYAAQPNHPGIIHYIIHTYDYPGLAEMALPAARKYASVAPSSAHALHMPSHIFTRLGLWDECIRSNLVSVASAKCYAAQAGIKGHWDEELHGMDYLVYAYLQKGENDLARAQLNYLDTFSNVYPANFKVAYAFAAIPSRYCLENKNWSAAAALQPRQASSFSWDQFPWQEAIVHFACLLGNAHTGNTTAATLELIRLNQLHDTLVKQKDMYKAKEVQIQVITGKAWIQFQSADKTTALNMMQLAADMEDSTEKNPVTPGEILPARELLGDMLLQTKQYDNALQAYETVLKKSPGRFNSLYGAGTAAEKSGNHEKAVIYFKQLLAMVDTVNCNRPEMVTLKKYK